MLLTNLLFIAAASPFFAFAQVNGQYPFDITTLRASDGSITAKFVSLGATMTELWVEDKYGRPRDVILGYDDQTRLLTDALKPNFNPIIGRYAGRIKNGTFSIPITKYPQPNGTNVFHTPLNDHDGRQTLHGGTIGWQIRNWTIASRSPTSVTYKHLDAADEGFPGNVTAYVTHTVHNDGILKTFVHASATEETPISVTQHIYWNLDAFQDNSTTILEHQLQIDSSRIIHFDGDEIPTGTFTDVPNTPFDFRTTRPIDWDWNQTVGLCGSAECIGYDHCFIYNQDQPSRPKVSLSSNTSGIRLEINSNNQAVQLFTAFGLSYLDIPRKIVHGGPLVNYTNWAGVALEQGGYADAINTPEFGVDQIYGPGKDYEWSTTYKFSVMR